MGDLWTDDGFGSDAPFSDDYADSSGNFFGGGGGLDPNDQRNAVDYNDPLGSVVSEDPVFDPATGTYTFSATGTDTVPDASGETNPVDGTGIPGDNSTAGPLNTPDFDLCTLYPETCGDTSGSPNPDGVPPGWVCDDSGDCYDPSTLSDEGGKTIYTNPQTGEKKQVFTPPIGGSGSGGSTKPPGASTNPLNLICQFIPSLCRKPGSTAGSGGSGAGSLGGRGISIGLVVLVVIGFLVARGKL